MTSRGHGRLFAFSVAVVLLAAACGGEESSGPDSAAATETPAARTQPASTSTAAAGAQEMCSLFDATVLHSLDLEVAAKDLPKLTPGSDVRVPARLDFDGTVLDDVGLRLKSGEASQQPLTGKPGLSIDTDKFDEDCNLFGITRFTLGNSINDPSFVTETVVYEVFRRAGVVAPRTALAEVSLNGDSLGLYVIREGYDKNFLRRTFEDPDGNLYEGALGVDVTDVEGMELHTNEARNDRRDLQELSRVVSEVPDASFLGEVGKYVDLDQLLTYWAVESIVHHWDGYLRPNNYYVYHDPKSGRFVFLAHGADWSMLDPAYSVLAQPGGNSRLALRLYENPEFRQQLIRRTAEVLDRYWDRDALLAIADQLGSLVRESKLDGARETISLETFEAEFAARRAFISSRAENVRAQLAAAGQ